MKTINELVELLRPDFVSVDNSNGMTPGTAIVRSFRVDYDVDGSHMYVKIDEDANDDIKSICVAMMGGAK